jgi:PAS domain S-box-containing protein
MEQGSSDDRFHAIHPDTLVSILNELPSGVHIIEPLYSKGKLMDFRFKFMNRKAGEFTGKEQVNSGFREVFTEDSFHQVRVVAENGYSISPVSLKLKDGQPKTYNCYVQKSGDWLMLLQISGGVPPVNLFEDGHGADGHDGHRVDGHAGNANNYLDDFRRIVSDTPIATITVMEDDRITYWNSAANELFGYAPEEAAGKSFIDSIVDPKEREEFREAVDNVKASREFVPALPCTLKNKAGASIKLHLTIFPLPNLEDETIGYCLLIPLRTDHVAPEVTSETAHFLNKVMETTVDIIYIIDLRTYELVYTNRDIAEYLGYTDRQIANMRNPLST